MRNEEMKMAVIENKVAVSGREGNNETKETWKGIKNRKEGAMLNCQIQSSGFSELKIDGIADYWYSEDLRRAPASSSS